MFDMVKQHMNTPTLTSQTQVGYTAWHNVPQSSINNTAHTYSTQLTTR
jgi:hypothetical protein